jgi:hypothetical protein
MLRTNCDHHPSTICWVQDRTSEVLSWDWGLYLASSAEHDDGIDDVD